MVIYNLSGFFLVYGILLIWYLRGGLYDKVPFSVLWHFLQKSTRQVKDSFVFSEWLEEPVLLTLALFWRCGREKETAPTTHPGNSFALVRIIFVIFFIAKPMVLSTFQSCAKTFQRCPQQKFKQVAPIQHIINPKPHRREAWQALNMRGHNKNVFGQVDSWDHNTYISAFNLLPIGPAKTQSAMIQLPMHPSAKPPVLTAHGSSWIHGHIPHSLSGVLI